MKNDTDKGNSASFPVLTDYEQKIFERFARRHKPGYWDKPIQLEGDKQLPVVAAGHRLQKKGVLCCHRSCSWYLTEIGERMAVSWQNNQGGDITTTKEDV